MALRKIQAEELPQKLLGIDETVWKFLRKCWSRDPKGRPSTAQVCDAFSPPQKIVPVPKGRRATDLPKELWVQVKSIKISLDGSQQQQFSVKFKYGEKDYTTSPVKCVDGSSEHTWFVLCPFLLALLSLNVTQEQSRKLVIRDQ